MRLSEGDKVEVDMVLDIIVQWVDLVLDESDAVRAKGSQKHVHVNLKGSSFNLLAKKSCHLNIYLMLAWFLGGYNPQSDQKHGHNTGHLHF